MIDTCSTESPHVVLGACVRPSQYGHYLGHIQLSSRICLQESQVASFSENVHMLVEVDFKVSLLPLCPPPD